MGDEWWIWNDLNRSIYDLVEVLSCCVPGWTEENYEKWQAILTVFFTEPHNRNSVIITQIRPQMVPSTSQHVCYLVIILSFSAVLSELMTLPFNKPGTRKWAQNLWTNSIHCKCKLPIKFILFSSGNLSSSGTFLSVAGKYGLPVHHKI